MNSVRILISLAFVLIICTFISTSAVIPPPTSHNTPCGRIQCPPGTAACQYNEYDNCKIRCLSSMGIVLARPDTGLSKPNYNLIDRFFSWKYCY
ncbi:hypothetical protein HA402_006327 [Bradysia odoriphaga]|nr:hypothetical protein HA402_006327 [Bradysia odoriphaga]